MCDWADQVICATNATRVDLNKAIRECRGFGPEPCIGDKVINLHNEWDIISNSGDWPLTNGCTCTITEMEKDSVQPPVWIYNKPVPILGTRLVLDDGDYFPNVEIDYNELITGNPTFTGPQLYQLNKAKFTPPCEFAYGYAITCHKSQGSEWPKVLLFEEKFPFKKDEHTRYLYTGITRSSNKVTIILK
jgi:exodeoxyribonuclease-5